jgi:alkylated DNA repair dioxygenase AlkB
MEQDYAYLHLNSSQLQNFHPKNAPLGLFVIPNWITEEEEQLLVNFFSDASKSGEWSDHISKKRPTKHFGYRYEIKGYASSTEKAMQDWGPLRPLADRIEKTFPGVHISQCLANLYFKDSTIGAHRDRETPMVFGLSIVGDINMIWTEMANENNRYEAFIPRRSLYIMSSDAALLWKHEVPSRKIIYYPDQNGNLTIKVPKQENYVRVSVTWRHFANTILPEQKSTIINLMNQQEFKALPDTSKLDKINDVLVSMNQAYLPPLLNQTIQTIKAQPPPVIPMIEACHLKNVIPKHKEHFQLLHREIPWQEVKSRFGGKLSRLIAPGAEKQSKTTRIYGHWVKLFCQRILGVKVRVLECFGNYYPNGNSALPAHRDDYNLLVFGLSFGETRTFDFVPNGVKDTIKRDPGIISITMESGDVVLFSPAVNKTHKHRILKEPKQINPRINLTYFLELEQGQDERKMYNPPERMDNIPTFEEAMEFEKQDKGKDEEGYLGEIVIAKDEEGNLYQIINGDIIIPVNSMEEAMMNLMANK